MSRTARSALALLVLCSAACTSTVGGDARSAAPAPPATSAASSSTSSAGSGTSFDPCSQLSDPDIASFGLDPSTKSDTSVAQGELGRGCGWANADVKTSFLVGDQTVDDLAARTADFRTITRLSVAGLDGVLLQVDDTGNCTVAVPSGTTAVAVIVTNKFSSVGKVDPCSTATTIATELVPLLPQ